MTASPRKNTVHKKYNPPTRRSKRYRPVKSSELVGIDAIELRIGELRCYVITMIDEHSNYALAQAVPSLNCDIIKLFFCRADRLFPIDINQGIADNGKEFPGNFDKAPQESASKPYGPTPLRLERTSERFKRTPKEQFIEFK